jgi:hypothetical protein
MPMAQADTAGYAPANWGGGQIPEIGPASTVLGANDCHFGINVGTKIQEANVAKLIATGKKDLAQYGPRAIDMAKRGGIVAETIWDEWQNGKSPHSLELEKFLITFDDIGTTKAVKRGEYPVGAKISGDDVGGSPKYGGTDKSLASLETAMNLSTANDATGMQVGTRWSKISIESTVLNRGVVHFHLDGMGNVQALCQKQGDYGYNVTSRELRYVFRNWARISSYCRFYNGFWESNGDLSVVMVKAPWD